MKIPILDSVNSFWYNHQKPVSDISSMNHFRASVKKPVSLTVPEPITGIGSRIRFRVTITGTDYG